MFCPNCGVKVNSLDVCPICGANLDMLQKYSLVKDTPPKNNYANIAVFARSLNLRKRSKDVNDFIKVQKDYLARQKAIAEEIKRKEETLAKQKQLLEEKQEELERSRKESQTREENKPKLDGNNEDSQGEFVPLAKIEPQKVAVQTNVARPQYANTNQSSQTAMSKTSISTFQNASQTTQQRSEVIRNNSQNQINQNSLSQQYQNNQQRQQNNQPPNQQRPQPRPPQPQPQPQQNSPQEYVPQRVTAPDDFDIPTINTESNATQFGKEIPMGDAVAVSKKADNLAKENSKRINKLSADEKKRKRKKRKFFGIISLIFSILCVFAVAFILIQKYSTSTNDFFVNIRLFMDHYGHYLVWGIIGGGTLAILFALIQVMIGGKKFSWIVFIIVIILVGVCIGYLYGTNNLIEPAKKLINFITNGFKE